jgi:hypothetical protein
MPRCTALKSATVLQPPLAKGDPADQSGGTKQRRRFATCHRSGHPTRAAGQSPTSELEMLVVCSWNVELKETEERHKVFAPGVLRPQNAKV